MFAAESFYVGEPVYLSNPAVSGTIDAIAWYSDRSNQISIDKNSSGATIVIQQYFSGTATIECSYGYSYYVGTKRQHNTGHAYYTISCKKSTVTLNKSSVTIAPGEEIKLSYTNSSGYKLPYCNWKSSDEKVATVNGGASTFDQATVTIKGINSGSCKITLYAYTGDESPVCDITVKEVPATGLKLSPERLSLKAGKTGSFKYTLTPNNASSKITWSSSNESVATVSSSGSIKAISEGTATITAKTDNGITATAIVDVVPAPTAVSLDNSLMLYVGYSSKVEPKLTPANAIATYKWVISDEKIATVDAGGNITAKTPGQTKLTVTTDNGHKASCTINIVEAPAGLDSRNVKVRTKALKDLISKTKKSIK